MLARLENSGSRAGVLFVKPLVFVYKSPVKARQIATRRQRRSCRVAVCGQEIYSGVVSR